MVNDADDIELLGKAMIKANGYLFKLVSAVNKDVETFNFGEDCLMV